MNETVDQHPSEPCSDCDPVTTPRFATYEEEERFAIAVHQDDVTLERAVELATEGRSRRSDGGS